MQFVKKYLMKHFSSKKMEKPKYEFIGHVLNKLNWEVVTMDEILLMELVGNNTQNMYFK